MDPLLLLLFAGVASLVGTAVSAKSQADANEANLQAVRETNTANAAISAENTKFSAEEAEKNRQFQLMMSNTAHQREVADLKAAGLNPYASSIGNGASVTSGSVAQPTTAQMEAGRVQSLGDVTGLSSLASLAQSAAFMMALGARADASNETMKSIANFNKFGYWR